MAGCPVLAGVGSVGSVAGAAVTAVTGGRVVVSVAIREVGCAACALECGCWFMCANANNMVHTCTHAQHKSRLHTAPDAE